MQDNGCSGAEMVDVEGRFSNTAARNLFLAFAACAALIALGAWQGDFGETLRNGTTL